MFSAALAALVGCGKLRQDPMVVDGGGKDIPGWAGDGGVACRDTGASQLPLGAPCGCAGDCASGQCVDGVCCASACGETCKRCNVTGSEGTCAFVGKGDLPRAAAQCPASDAAECGLDGTCDGAGGCANYPPGVMCGLGVCAPAAVTGTHVCDGEGRCRPGPDTICAPFGCDANTSACTTTCTGPADCATGVSCVAGSCGPKPNGAVCDGNGACASGFC